MCCNIFLLESTKGTEIICKNIMCIIEKLLQISQKGCNVVGKGKIGIMLPPKILPITRKDLFIGIGDHWF